MKISIGSDHAGFPLKEKVVTFLKQKGFEVVDQGTYSEDSVDYNDAALVVAKDVQEQRAERGILICGTGIGMSIQANKTPGIRAALVHDKETASLTRLHNDSNVLTMGGRIVDHALALDIVDLWVNTEFSEDPRHQRRIQKLEPKE